MKTFDKIKFLIQKQKIVVVSGKGKETAKEAVKLVLGKKFNLEKEVLIFDAKDSEIENYFFYLTNSPLAVLAVTHVGEIPFDRDYFAGEKENVKNILKLTQKLPPTVKLVLNYDDETVREIDDFTNLHRLTFGFDEKADISISNLKFNRGMNFKVHFEGNWVPFWLEGIFGKEQIYAILCAVGVGRFFGINLIEISEVLKKYKSLPGKMRLIEGIKGVFILDDAKETSVFSMMEAIDILGKIPDFKRKIAVLGDVSGIEKYTKEAHETIGEKVAKEADLLFTFGKKARFIGKGALEKGMSSSQIFSFDTIEEGIEKLKATIKPGDLILVDGSTEMRMSEIVDKLRKIW
jgi:UDP-N-acetylmuramoyl-tripeptide--D-alanyl-D-alanine ligase